MKIIVNKVELSKEVNNVLPFVERKTTIPILSNILFKAEHDHVTITGTDLDVTLQTELLAQVHKEGTVTIPARKLADVLKKLKTLPEDQVTITLLENNWVRLTCGAFNVKLVGMDANNFPHIAHVVKDALKLPARALLTMIDRTRFAISQEESRYTLNGALFIASKNAIKMVATDGHRLTYAEHGISNGPETELKVLIPSGAIDRVRTLLKASDGDTITFAVVPENSAEGNNMTFNIDGRILTSRKLTGQFPNYEAVLPKNNTKLLTVKAAAFNEVLGRVIPFADERSRAIKLNLAEQGLTLSASSTETGEASELVSSTYNDEPLTIGFNGEYISTYLNTYKNGAEITVKFRDNESCGLFEPAIPDDVKSLMVVMPMRL